MGNNSGPEAISGGGTAATAALEEAWSALDGPITRQVTAVVVGAGQRGQNYANFALDFPARLKVVAVAEPLAHRRDKMRKLHGLDETSCVADWSQLAEMDRMADCAIIATQDQMHREPAVAFAKKGYHILLEKPMAISVEDCTDIAQVCEQQKGLILAVCHVLRYFPPVIKIKEVIDSGVLGDVITINHMENILYWHFAHSFVRGNWRNEETSTFSLLAKCCHDIDLIMYWMGDRRCTKIQSFGGLHHFKSSNRPAGSSDRCLTCPVEEPCPYSAQKVYLKASRGVPHWPMSVVCDIEDHPKGYLGALEDALRQGPYGRCVYACDNDVCDHQMVNMEFESGATATMTMNAFTRDMRRETRICGSKGELRWDGSSEGPIVVYDFATRSETKVMPDRVAPPCRTAGHGGSDFFLVNAFTKAVASNNPSLVSTGIRDSLRSHLLVFAAEKSRKNGTIESVDI